ncbi:hypothetical protein ACFY05_07485 [Microtetraspora fusca]|uniref:Uncharacterized protein n=1 Tax=Microtetraspora fusca TaxID=1997 RepID=A0ABW6V171_MICFU
MLYWCPPHLPPSSEVAVVRLGICPGVNRDEPDVPVVMLVVDPDGTPGERAVARLGDYCYEGDGVFFLLQTDGWAEHALDDNRLVVEIAVSRLHWDR